MWKLRGITVVDLQNHFIIVVGKAVDRSRQVLFGNLLRVGDRRDHIPFTRLVLGAA